MVFAVYILICLVQFIWLILGGVWNGEHDRWSKLLFFFLFFCPVISAAFFFCPSDLSRSHEWPLVAQFGERLRGCTSSSGAPVYRQLGVHNWSIFLRIFLVVLFLLRGNAATPLLLFLNYTANHGGQSPISEGTC